MKRLMLASLLALPLMGLSQDKASAFFSVCGKYNTNINLRWCGTYSFTMPKVRFCIEWAPKPCCDSCNQTSGLPLPWQAAFPPQYYYALQRNYPTCPEFGGSGYQGGYAAPGGYAPAAGGCPGCAQLPQQSMPQAQAPMNQMMQAGYRPTYPMSTVNYANYGNTGAVPYYWYGR